MSHRLHVPIAVAALALSATAWGSTGDVPPHAASAPAATAAAFNGTAHLTTHNTVLYDGKTEGFARKAGQGLVDQCNGFRATGYHLSPVSPSEDTMASLDVFVHEKYFDTDKALTVITGKNLVLPDMKRWLEDYKASATSGSMPAVPPDCAKVEVVETRNGTLWRDGRVYELHYDTKKASGRKASTTLAPYRGTNDFARLPLDHQLGQPCREVVGVEDLGASSEACIWDLFPYVAYLNWPFALKGRVQFGPMKSLFETIVPVVIEHGQPIAPDTFQIPPGFKVTGS